MFHTAFYSDFSAVSLRFVVHFFTPSFPVFFPPNYIRRVAFYSKLCSLLPQSPWCLHKCCGRKGGYQVWMNLFMLRTFGTVILWLPLERTTSRLILKRYPFRGQTYTDLLRHWVPMCPCKPWLSITLSPVCKFPFLGPVFFGPVYCRLGTCHKSCIYRICFESDPVVKPLEFGRCQSWPNSYGCHIFSVQH